MKEQVGKDNSTGYLIKNLCLACPDCNKIKSNLLTPNDMLFIGKYFIKPKHNKCLTIMEKL